MLARNSNAVLLRAISDPPEVENSKTLSALARRLYDRPYTSRAEFERPLYVDRDTFTKGEREMESIMLARGYKTIAMSDIGLPNFLLMNVPIVCSESD